MSNDDISDSLDMTNLEDVTPKQVVPVTAKSIVVKDSTADERQFETDAAMARNNIIDIVTKGGNALDEIMDVANQSQHPRAYEVVSTIMNGLVSANESLLKLHKEKKEFMASPSTTDDVKTVNNTQINLTTADLLNMIQDKNDR